MSGYTSQPISAARTISLAAINPQSQTARWEGQAPLSRLDYYIDATAFVTASGATSITSAVATPRPFASGAASDLTVSAITPQPGPTVPGWWISGGSSPHDYGIDVVLTTDKGQDLAFTAWILVLAGSPCNSRQPPVIVGAAGAPGAPGVGIMGATVSEQGALLLELTNYATIAAAGSVMGPVGAMGPQGPAGATGATVTGGTVEENGHLVLELGNGGSVDVGSIVGPAGPEGATGPAGLTVTSGTVMPSGSLVIGLSNSSTVDVVGSVVGPVGPAGAAGAQGVAGRGVESGTVEGSGHLVFTMSDSGTVDVGSVVGPQGPAGAAGAAGPAGAQGPAGAAGTSVSGGTVEGSGHLVFTMSNAETFDVGNVVGPAGPAGVVDTTADLTFNNGTLGAAGSLARTAQIIQLTTAAAASLVGNPGTVAGAAEAVSLAPRLAFNGGTVDLATTGVAAGAVTKPTVDIYGRVVSGGTLGIADINGFASGVAAAAPVQAVTANLTLINGTLDAAASLARTAETLALNNGGTISQSVAGTVEYTGPVVLSGGATLAADPTASLNPTTKQYTDVRNKFVFSNVAAMLAAPITAYDISTLSSGLVVHIYLQGYYEPGDYGGGELFWAPGSTATVDGFSVFQPAAITGSNPGRILRIIDPSSVYPQMAGAYANGHSATPNDDTFAINVINTYFSSATMVGGYTLKIAPGSCHYCNSGAVLIGALNGSRLEGPDYPNCPPNNTAGAIYGGAGFYLGPTAYLLDGPSGIEIERVGVFRHGLTVPGTLQDITTAIAAWQADNQSSGLTKITTADTPKLITGTANSGSNVLASRTVQFGATDYAAIKALCQNNAVTVVSGGGFPVGTCVSIDPAAFNDSLYQIQLTRPSETADTPIGTSLLFYQPSFGMVLRFPSRVKSCYVIGFGIGLQCAASPIHLEDIWVDAGVIGVHMSGIYDNGYVTGIHGHTSWSENIGGANGGGSARPGTLLHAHDHIDGYRFTDIDGEAWVTGIAFTNLFQVTVQNSGGEWANTGMLIYGQTRQIKLVNVSFNATYECCLGIYIDNLQNPSICVLIWVGGFVDNAAGGAASGFSVVDIGGPASGMISGVVLGQDNDAPGVPIMNFGSLVGTWDVIVKPIGGANPNIVIPSGNTTVSVISMSSGGAGGEPLIRFNNLGTVTPSLAGQLYGAPGGVIMQATTAAFQAGSIGTIAAAGTSAATATPINAQNCVVTGGTGGVLLVNEGIPVEILNRTTAAINVFVPNGGEIETYGSVTLGVGQDARYLPVSAELWYS